MSESQLQKLRRRHQAVVEPEARAPVHEPEDEFIAADYEPAGQKAFSTATGKRQPGFAVVMVDNNARYWVFYHSIRRLKSFEENGHDYIQFSHEDLAVTIEGHRLAVLLNLIGEGRLKAVFEPTGKPAAASSRMTDPVITAILVTDIEAGKNEGLKLVKSAQKQ